MVWMDLSSGIQTEINVEAKQTAATAEERSLKSPGTGWGKAWQSDDISIGHINIKYRY